MARKTPNPAFDCVCLDLGTQQDFLDPRGAYPVSNQFEVVHAIRKLVNWAQRNHVPVVSAIDAHRPHDFPHYNRPPHCLDGTRGQDKLSFTVFSQHVHVEFDNTLCVPLDLLSGYQQVIFRKRDDDLFSNPKADRFITQLPVRQYFLFGCGMENSIRILVLGLLARNKRVTVVYDACGHWEQGSADLALRQVVAKGAETITTDELVARSFLNPYQYSRAPSRRRCTVFPGPAPQNGNGRAPTPGCPRTNGQAPTNGRALPPSGPSAKLPPSNGSAHRPPS